MKMGDLVRCPTEGPMVGIVIKLYSDQSSPHHDGDRGGWIMWDDGTTCYAAEEEVEVICESR